MTSAANVATVDAIKTGCFKHNKSRMCSENVQLHFNLSKSVAKCMYNHFHSFIHLLYPLVPKLRVTGVLPEGRGDYFCVLSQIPVEPCQVFVVHARHVFHELVARLPLCTCGASGLQGGNH